MNFEFRAPKRIVFGAGVSGQLVDAASELGKRILLVTGANVFRQKQVLDPLASRGLSLEFHSVHREPSVADLDLGLEKAREFCPDCIVAIGGGAVLDLAKGIAALLDSGHPAIDHFAIKSRPASPFEPSIPLIAVPTTAGTGSEATANAVFLVDELKVKLSLRHPNMLPKVAVVDPGLLVGLPTDRLFGAAFDALAHNAESYLSRSATPMTDLYAFRGLALAAEAIPVLHDDPSNPSALSDMALASLFGGMALANGGLGIVHGFASVIGGVFHLPHGAICARLLASGLETNFAGGDSAVRRRISEIVRLLVQDGSLKDVARWIGSIADNAKVPLLRAAGIRRSQVFEIAKETIGTSSYARNPVSLPIELVGETLARALERETVHAS